MSDTPRTEALPEVVCPHCGKTFEPEPLDGGAPGTAGFKCPHCRLFVARDRAETPEPAGTE